MKKKLLLFLIFAVLIIGITVFLHGKASQERVNKADLSSQTSYSMIEDNLDQDTEQVIQDELDYIQDEYREEDYIEDQLEDSSIMDDIEQSTRDVESMQLTDPRIKW